jgi:hypothetical protein
MCCDGVWMPSLAFRNIVSLPEGRVEPVSYLSIAPDNMTVVWRQSVHGIWFSPM